MPSHASSSVQPTTSRSNPQDALQLRNINENRNRQSNQRRNYDNVAQQGNGPNQNSHMTLDGRRHPRNAQRQAPSPENEQWNDWTSTWRRMGNKGQSQAVTMSGTITRGKKKGQVVDVQLDLTNGELMEISTTHDRLNSATATPDTPDSMPSSGIEPKTSECGCGIAAGPHILLFSIIAFPFIFVGSLFVSFYFGALSWQNIFSYYYDERTIWHRIFICPLLVLSFPLSIVIFTLGIAAYAAFAQLRWSFAKWRNEAGSLEKGFYGWLCEKLGLEECSPYTVIELFSSTEVQGESRQPSARNPDNTRVTVVYSERGSRRSQGSRLSDRSSLPSASRQSRMQRVESTM